MAQVNLERASYLVDDGNDGKVIIRALADIPGGRALDCSAWGEDVVRSGHIIKHNTVTGEYAPLGVSAGAYVELAEKEENNDYRELLGGYTADMLSDEEREKVSELVKEWEKADEISD